ncbi:MAG: hypothetical protein HY000_16815 [Planctomycetes bacterium]|nr:hypothetical protein [Planctomycetota bacterium]
MKRNSGNRTRTAAQLGVSPRGLFKKITKHNLG